MKYEKNFQFETMWLQDPRCDEFEIESWQEGLNKTRGNQLINFIDKCCERLKEWNKVEFGRVGRNIDGL